MWNLNLVRRRQGSKKKSFFYSWGCDAYLMVQPTLQALAGTVRSFRQDADLEVCLDKCTIYMQGIQIERAQTLIRECIEADMSCQPSRFKNRTERLFRHSSRSLRAGPGGAGGADLSDHCLSPQPRFRPRWPWESTW
jgi:hypothetical protein